MTTDQHSLSEREWNKDHDSGETEGPDREFINSFVKVQRRLYLYLLAQVGVPNAAEEVLQNVNVVMLSKWEQFEAGTNFQAWAFRIASLEVLKYRQRLGRNRLVFDDSYLTTIARATEELSEGAEARQEALAICLEKLKSRDRELIRLRYQQGQDGQALSESLDRPVNSIYQSLGRIRKTLLNCIEKQLSLAATQ